MKNTTQTTGTANSRQTWGRLAHAARTWDRHMLAYRVIRRVLCAGCFGGETPLILSGLYTANVADLPNNVRGRRYEIRPATEQDLPRLSTYFGSDRPIANRYRRGDIGVLAVRGDEICAAVWLATGPTEYSEDVRDLGCSLAVPEGVVFSYDGKGTRLGAWGTLMAHLPRLLDELQIRQIVTLIDYENTLSIRSHRSLGYRREGYVGCVKFARWVQSFYTDAGGIWRMLPGRIGSVSLRRERPARKDAERQQPRRTWRSFTLAGRPLAKVAFAASRIVRCRAHRGSDAAAGL